MENRRWDNDRDYNERWDEYADRDRYERDFYQNRNRKPQGYSYDNDRDQQGAVDYHRYGTGYTGNDYDRFDENRSGRGFGHDQYGSGSSNTRSYDSQRGRTNYGYAENRNRGYGRRSGQDYGSQSYGSGYGSSDWNRSANRTGGMRDSERRSYGNYGFNEPGYGSGSSRHRSDRNRGDYEYYLGRTGGDYNRYEPFRDEDRNWWDRTTDEVASWFGDDEAERRREMDRRESHRGKGVKGYQRSDEKIKSDLEDELYDDSYIDASDMTVSVTNGVVTLAGSVDSKWTKRRAEDMAETISGVTDVSNRLTVRKEENTSSDTSKISNTGSGMKSDEGNMTTNTSYKAENKNKKKAEA